MLYERDARFPLHSLLHAATNIAYWSRGGALTPGMGAHQSSPADAGGVTPATLAAVAAARDRLRLEAHPPSPRGSLAFCTCVTWHTDDLQAVGRTVRRGEIAPMATCDETQVRISRLRSTTCGFRHRSRMS